MKQILVLLMMLSTDNRLIPGITIGQLADIETSMIRQGLVDVRQIDPAILVDLKYSTTDNFVGKDVYGELSRAYLQPLAADKLALANRYLREYHPTLRLLIYDAARPRSAQWNLWNALVQYPPVVRRTYVADPRIGSIHNYGCAVDVTIARVSSDPEKGTPLDMGTKFDYFGELAYPTQETRLLKAGQLTQLQIDNRALLRAVMGRAGFTAIDYEWWHFNALSRKQASILYKIIE